jgi:chitinase
MDVETHGVGNIRGGGFALNHFVQRATVDAGNQVAIHDGYAATNLFYPGDCREADCKRGSFHQITLFKRRHPVTKFPITVGGWTLSAPFYALAADRAKRGVFAQSCSNFPAKYTRFDGADLDWEHPVIGGQEPWGAPADAANFRLLLQAVCSAIGDDKLLTVAVSAGAASIAALEYPQMAGIVDWFNVMTYDFHGSWNNYVGHNSPLYNNADPTGSIPTNRRIVARDFSERCARDPKQTASAAGAGALSASSIPMKSQATCSAIS